MSQSKKQEANLVSFKVLLTRDNKLVTEFSTLPESEVDNLFKNDSENEIIKTILQLGLKTNYDQRENPLEWLDEVMGVEHQNFFEGRATSYMKAGLRGRQDKITFTGLES